MTKLIQLLGLIFINGICLCSSYSNSIERENVMSWCTTSKEEQRKCQHLAMVVERDYHDFRDYFMQIQCKQAFNIDECMTMLDEEKASITLVDAGEVFVGGRYHSLVPIMQERLTGGQKFYYAVAVVKRGSLLDVGHLSHLRGKRACFGGVGTQAGWVLPVYTMMQYGGMQVIDCNNHVKSTINFFGPSCAVNSLIDKYNPIGDNSDRLCELCTGKVPGGKCTSHDPYAGFEGAFRCLVEKGDIAFVKHTTVAEMTTSNVDFPGVKKDNFELLCVDGSRRPIDDFRSCNWGPVQSHAIVTTSAKSPDVRRLYQDFLQRIVQLYGRRINSTIPFNPQDPFNNPANRDFNSDPFYANRFNQTGPPSLPPSPGFAPDPYRPFNPNVPPPGNYDPRRPIKRDTDKQQMKRQVPAFPPRQTSYDPNDPFYNGPAEEAYRPPAPHESFELFSSAPRYGIRHNLLLNDNVEDLLPLDESHQNYEVYLGPALKQILGVRQCPVNRMSLCVTSKPEMDKCIKMRTALKAQLLKPEMVCVKGHSHIHCMEQIRSGTADVTVLDASDVYTGGVRFDLIPFIAEVYNLGLPDYYVVAVAKEQDPTTELTFLKGKYTCHTGMNTAAGWVVPMAYLMSNSWIRSYGCDSVRTAAEYFGKSCIPGALSNEYNTGVPYDNMCDLCHGTSSSYCRRDASEDFYGYTGALRCLVEGGGDVAFVKHTTVAEVSDGKRDEWWARNALSGDFELLCPDGRRMNTQDYKKCNLGKAKANAIVTRGGEGYNETEVNAFINLFVYAQQFYGRRDTDEFSFSMFYSQPPYSDLIFQDATQQLLVLNYSQRHYASYVGKDFLRARRIVDCHAGAKSITSHTVSIILSMALALIFSHSY
ncbi:uncharacterized protein LOC113212723 [Frankliniella occidentalis]|uniref:Uncharacterized protein LOC113212723 n=1 Tax=Frankliniella occidentalis TaxID=133901 RepID=A0A6J1T191_FRAOC|nr:uncharacterized protein LOC113212723 [Frankliniella occidentalis]